MTPSTTLAYQGSRPLIGLLAGHTVSLTGNMLTLVALPLYVLAETGSATATGLAGFFAYLPVVIGGPLGGVLVDRFGYRRSSITADLTSAGTIGSVPLLDATFGLPLWLLFALVFLSGLLDTPGQTARSALVPDVATAAGIPLERAVGWMEATERAARLMGALLAGFLVLALGALPVLALDAGTFVISAALVALLVPREFDLDTRRLSTRPDDAPQGYWRQLAEGFAFTVREPLLRAVVLLVIITNLFDAAKTTVILPVYAQRELGGALALGLLVAAMGAGALVGSLAFGAIGHRLPRRRTFVLAFALAGAPPYFAIAVGLSLPALLTVAVLSGCAAGAINPIIGTIELERVPAGMRARVFGLIGAGCWAAMPLGALVAGVAIERLGMTTTVVAVGVAYLLVTLTPLLGGPWRAMDRV
jgi:MFS family permease